MDIETVSSPREPLLLRALLAPMRVAERLRGWQLFGFLMLLALLAMAAWGLIRRQSSLNGLPDVGEPFDVAAFLDPARVPDDRNAFTLYRRAASLYRELSGPEGDSFGNANLQWPRADATLRGWVADQAEAIALLREGSGRPEAQLLVPRRAKRWLETSEKNEVARRLSWIGDAALFEAGRLRASGDRAGAWALLRAVVRTSRHMERVAPTIQGRSHATTLAQFAHGPVAEWAEDPAVEPSLLRRALDDLVAAEALTPPPSLTYREEYLAAAESLGDLGPRIAARARRRLEGGKFDPMARFPELEAFLDREPERSRRVLRLLAANDFAWIDRPAAQRPGFAETRLRIYNPDPAAPPASRALPPDELTRWADSSLVDPTPPWRLGDIELWERSDRRVMGMLREAVAVPLFTRELGRPPASPAEALRRYHPMPGDDPSRDEAEPIPARPAEKPPGP